MSELLLLVSCRQYIPSGRDLTMDWNCSYFPTPINVSMFQVYSKSFFFGSEKESRVAVGSSK